MKTGLSVMSAKLRSQNGAVLPAAAISAAILAIVVAGVLTYMSNEYVMNVRSHRWTQALHLAEGAVEIGFAEFHYKHFLGNAGFSSSDGWIAEGSGTYSKSVSNFVDNAGAVIGDLSVTVTGVSGGAPRILGVASLVTPPRGPSIARAVRVTLATSATFPTAMAAKRDIDMNGNNIYVDSFDSTDPSKSTGGLYDPTKRQANGNVATNAELEDSLDLGNADIYGQVATGENGTVELGRNGSIGPTFVDADRATTLADAEDNGWVRHDFQVDIPDAKLPSGMSSAYNLGNVSNSLGIMNGSWRMSSLTLQSSEYVAIYGNVRIYVSGDTSVTGNARFIINPGASLEFYSGGSMMIAGQGVVNHTGQAANNRYYGLNASTTWSINGNGQWVGTVYAPNARVRLVGGGANGDMSGSIIAKSITLDGKVSFHYDESLDTNNDPTGYLVASWQSLRLDGGAWVPE